MKYWLTWVLITGSNNLSFDYMAGAVYDSLSECQIRRDELRQEKRVRIINSCSEHSEE